MDLTAPQSESETMSAFDSTLSVHREKAAEHIFLGELSRRLLATVGQGPEILRAEHDSFGYDVVLEFAGVIRHVQFKLMRKGGRNADVGVKTALAAKPGGCVLWIILDETDFSLGPFGWLGGRVGEPLPDLGEKPVFHTKRDSEGRRGVRPGLRALGRKRFTWLTDIDDVIEAMFGPRSDLLLRTHLLSRMGEPLAPTAEPWLRRVQAADFTRLPEILMWEQSCHLAHLIDGYQLIETLELGDPFALRDLWRERAMRTGRWAGSALELWIALFLEHRAEHFGERPAPEDIAHQLPAALVSVLRAGSGDHLSA